MEKIIAVYCLTKAGEMVKNGIYKNEIVNKAKTGAEKFNEIADNFWDKLKDYVIKEKEIDRKWIPNEIENLGEDILIQSVDILKEKLKPKSFIQEIFNIEKATNPNIL